MQKRQKDWPLLEPEDAARKNGTAFYAFYPLRKWNVVEGIKQHIGQEDCGRLCSLRFCRLAPKSLAAKKEAFRNRMIPWFLDAAFFLADSEPVELFLQKAPGKGNNLFGLQ
ncbi:MAG: hypothetical protein GX902_09405 [Lentisphaerae bacterium]|nr:hypothetical protein [Lentisphaerota bacterium]